MRYLMLVCVDPTGEPYSKDHDDVEGWVGTHDASGARVLGERTRPAEDARVVRVRGDDTRVTTGAVVEGDVKIAGFDILECADMDAAVSIASGHPMARFGCIELREFWPWEG